MEKTGWCLQSNSFSLLVEDRSKFFVDNIKSPVFHELSTFNPVKFNIEPGSQPQDLIYLPADMLWSFIQTSSPSAKPSTRNTSGQKWW